MGIDFIWSKHLLALYIGGTENFSKKPMKPEELTIPQNEVFVLKHDDAPPGENADNSTKHHFGPL